MKAMKRYIIAIIGLMLSYGLKAQTRTCRYWFDGNLEQSVTTSFNGNTWDGQIDVSQLPDGIHSLHYYLTDTTSTPVKGFLFHKISTISTSDLRYYYWFDEDYGHQQTGALGDGNLLLDVTALEDGEHVVRIFLEGSTVAAPQSYIFMKGGEGATYEITASAVPADGGTITGAGTYYENNTCTLTATPNEGYSFVCWKENGSVISQEATYTFTVTGNRNLVAQFSGTGVDEFEGESLVLYPNPVNDLLFVESIGIIRKCEVYSLTGQLMLSLTEGSERLEVPVENLPDGTYMVRLVTDRFVKTSKFVKK